MVLEQQQEQEKEFALCLNMIVKNESHIIKDKLTKLLQKVKFDYWVISDTGSTDKTKEIITDFFKEVGIPGEIYEDDWVDFAHNRNRALEYAFGKSKYLLVFDADDEICGDFVLPELTRDSYSLQFGSYTRPQIVNNRKRWKYVGVLHEYICSADSRIDDANTEIIKGPYHVISGRSGNRNLDSNKYLKDAIILEKAYNDAVNAKDDIHIRYGFYCANSYYDCGKYENAISWYKKTLENGGWAQEKYVSCLKLYICYDNLDKKKEGFFYLVKSAEYDRERAECYCELIKFYSGSGLHDIAYGYYGVLRDFYRDNYLKTGLNNKLFVNMSISEFHLPYYVIIVCEKMRDYETGIHMYRIIFTKKCKIFDTWLVGNLLYNLQFFINHVKEEDKSTFYSLFKEYADFLVANNYPLSDGKHEFMKGYEKCGIVVPSRFESVSVSKDKEECSKSKKILFYSGFAPFAWNYTYSTQHALGGSETALANLSKLFPSDFEIYVAGNVLEEKIANNDNGHTNVTYVNIQNLSNLVKTNAFHTVIVSRYVGFYDMYPETACYQSFIWGHDIVLLSSGSNMDVESILSKWSDKITGCICQTEWHKKLFVTNYPMLKDKMFVINNGIILDKFINKPVKIPNRFIYTSCSERGLERLLKLWPQIIEKMPDAELYISSYNRFPSNEFEFRLRDVIDRHEGVKHVGSLNKAQLYEMMASAEYWLYPTSFSETSCITAMEMLMSEVICIYYPLAGLNNTLGKYGIQVIPGTEIQSIMNLSEEKKAEMKINGKKYAMSCSWENRAKEWASVLGLNTDSELLFFINTNYRADKILNNDCIIKIINLERRSDRKTDMINKLSEKMVNNYEFFEAVDGNVLEPSVFIKNLFKNNDFNYRKGVIGCALSHYELWNNLINDDKYSYYVILEDDIEIVDNFNEYIEQSISIIQKQDIKYALIGGYQIKDKLTSADIISFDKITEQISSGTFGYIISKKACIKLVNYLNKNGINRAIDHSDLYTTCLDMYRINKYLVTSRAYQIHGETDTDIQLDYNCLNFNSMPNYTVSFVDWWSEEYCGGTFDNHNNYFTKLLSDFYDIKVVSPEENPDILFYSIFGNNHLNLNAKRKIFYTGEAIPQQPNADFNITFDNDNDNNCRLPLWLCYLNDTITNDYNNKIQNKIEAPQKSKFCSIICQQDNVENTRSEIVNKLSKYKRVDCGGKFMNNIGYVVPRGINCSGKIEHNNNYKFVIAFENKDYPGYVTEKICDAYKSKCIPIYWGTKDVVKDFNPNTFINANDFVSMDELVEFIIMVDNNDKLYASYFKETIFSNKWLETFNDINKIFYKNLADRIIGKDTNLLNANTIEQINFLDYKIEYGIDENKIDITYKVVAHSLNKKFIEIPTDDVLRAELYGDPCCGVVKFIYVTNSEGIVTKFPDNKSITLDITRGLITTIIEPNYLTVYKSPYDKIRLGKDYDGGYIICDIPDIKYDFFLSGGILDDISFEEDFCYKYPDVKCLAHDGFIDNIDIKNNNITFIKKYIGDSDNQYFTNLHSLIDQYNNIFIKMDIEGGEIPWINSLSTEQIDKFAQIVMEFHFPFYEKECLVFEKLLTSHVLVHFHANNCCGTNIVKNIKIPNVFECTYIHKKYYNDKLILNTDNIPGTLDMKNVLDKDEIYIDYPPFVHPTSEHLSLSSIVDNVLTDKNTRHSYLELYESIMHKNKFTAKNILEIGIDVGGSMKLWNDYFINATIYGLDINESPNFLNKYPRINTFKINAYTIDSVNYFVEKDIKFDFIIDDGPHTLESMIFTLIHYSKLLTPQGVLIIEDIQSIEWAYLFEKITNKYKENTHIYDLRENKGRYDDIVFTFTNSNIENIEFIDYNIEYGLDDNKINITHKVMSHSFNKEFIEIPTDDVLRAELYGDICWGVVKSIYITTKDGSVTKCKDNYPIILDWQGILIKKPNFLYKLSACLLIKNETENLNDWIEHYINEGVEHFFITSNNSTDGIDNFILNSEYKNMITLITDNSDINIYNDQLEHRNCLCKNFYNIIKNYTEWCILVDIDEFMYGKNGYTLSSFIDTLDEDIGCFYVYWNIFKPTVDSENKISDQFSLKKSCKRINLDLISDLSYEIKFASKFGKSIFRTSMLQDHTQLWIHKVFTSGKIITNYGNISNYNYDNVDDICWSESNYTKVNICLNHYAIRNKKDYNNKSCQLENKHRYPFVKGLLDICELDNKYIIEDDYILKHNCIQNNTIFKIGFYDNGLSERGTSTMMFSYADYAEKYFKCKSIIFYNRTHYSNNNEVIDKFRKRFIVYDIDNFDEINNIIVEKNIKYFYNTCAGKRNCTELVKNCKNLIHAVFNIEPFGDIYAGISDYIVKKSKYPDIDAIPYMIDLPIHNENMRHELILPDNAFIIGRIGGYEQFDVPEAHNAIIKFLNSLNDTNPVNDFISKINNSNNKNHTYKNETNRKVYFVFVNTNRFYEHPQIIYLDKIIDPYLKVKYINTCNCMIHARSDGETFGLAVGEFSSLNKPIITCRSNLENCHLEILGDKAIIFDSTDSLITILENIQTISNSRDDWNTYKEYTPEKVMIQFKDVFLSNENMYL